MRFLTTQETRAWCKGNPPFLDDRGHPVQWPASFQVIRFAYPHEPAPRLFYISRCLIYAVDYWDEALLWVVLTRVWASSENTHLYYRLRQSYGDHRHLEEAPGHLVLRHEGEDLKTLLHLSLLFGWEAFLFTDHDYARVFVCHDEYAEVAVPEGHSLATLRGHLESGGLKVELGRSAV